MEKIYCLSHANEGIQKVRKMKKGLHPELYDCEVSCACGNTFVTKSVKPSLRIDICNECHPFFTGSERMVDTAGRIDKFKKRYNLDK